MELNATFRLHGPPGAGSSLLFPLKFLDFKFLTAKYHAHKKYRKQQALVNLLNPLVTSSKDMVSWQLAPLAIAIRLKFKRRFKYKFSMLFTYDPIPICNMCESG